MYLGKYSVSNGSVECALCDAGKINMYFPPISDIRISLAFILHFSSLICTLNALMALYIQESILP